MDNTPIHKQEDDSLHDEAWLASYVQCEKKTTQAWRTRGGGPVFHRVGRLIRYRKKDVDAWLESRRAHSTSEK